MLSIRDKLKTKILRKTESKRMENIYQANMNQRNLSIFIYNTHRVIRSQHYNAAPSRIRRGESAGGELQFTCEPLDLTRLANRNQVDLMEHL